MRSIFLLVLMIFTIACNALESDTESTKPMLEVKPVVWTQGMNVEKFWMSYAESKGGLTWSESTTYPDYEKLKEGDTFLVRLNQGPCLMEFFHRRWRRANDVKRWDDSMNKYGGCPFVFN